MFVWRRLAASVASVAGMTNSWTNSDSHNWWSDMGKALGAVAAAEVFDKTWFIMILVSLRLNKWAAFAGGYVALSVHVGLAAAIGYGVSQIPGLQLYVLDFVTAGLLLLFSMMYACEAHKTEPGTDLMAEGREEAAADLKEAGNVDGEPKEEQRSGWLASIDGVCTCSHQAMCGTARRKVSDDSAPPRPQLPHLFHQARLRSVTCAGGHARREQPAQRRSG